MFRRRLLLTIAASSALWISACSQAIPSKISISQAQMQQGLKEHFPKNFPVAGLLQLQMQEPMLSTQPASNQLQTTINVQLSGPTLRQPFRGMMDVRFGLRYQAKDRTVRAHRVEVQQLQLEGAAPAMAAMVSTYGNRLATQALENFVLYTVPTKDLQLADTLGLQPGAITVTSQGLDVAIESKSAN